VLALTASLYCLMSFGLFSRVRDYRIIFGLKAFVTIGGAFALRGFSDLGNGGGSADRRRSYALRNRVWLDQSCGHKNGSLILKDRQWAICVRGALGFPVRGAAGREGLARPERPRRWTLPITALRVTPPSCLAI